MAKKLFLKRIFVLVVAFLIITLPVASTYALSEEMLDMFANNNILFYDPDDGNYKCPDGTYKEGPIVLNGDTPQAKIWFGLTSFLTPEQAAGVMGNMESESHFNPAQHEVSKMDAYQPGFALDGHADISYGLGLIQWSFDRRIGMYNYVKSMNAALVDYFNDYNSYSPTYWNGDLFTKAAGEDIFDELVSLELQYLKDELNNNPNYNGLLQTATVYDATKFFLEHVEIPDNPTIEAHQNRVTQADTFYTQFAGGDGNVAAGASRACGTNLQTLADYVRAYVWPEHHNPPFLDRMPEYAAAVTKRKSEGKYVGGTVDGVPGIDCGGFVTTIMQESGYDPDYNGCASNTAPQEYWLREGGSSDKWVWLNPNGEKMDPADLQLGDVAFTGAYYGNCSAGGDHTWMWIGDFEGFQTNVASASYSSQGNGRAPMSGTEGASYNNPRWYRKVK